MAEARQPGLDGQVAVQEPLLPHARDVWWVGRVVAADLRSDLLGHPVQRVDDPRVPQAAGEPPEEARPAVLRVDEVGSLQAGPERGRAGDVELVRHRHGLRLHAEPAEALGELLAPAQHQHVHALPGDPRRELPQMRDRPAALDRRDVDDPHPGSGAAALRRCPSTQIAPVRPPISQNGRKYCSERNIALTTAIVSEIRNACTKAGSP